jgi:hypothetical protein
MIDRKTMDEALDTGRVYVKSNTTWWKARRTSATVKAGRSWFVGVHAGHGGHILTNQNDNVEFRIVEQCQ